MTVVVTHTTPADSSFSSTGAAAWNADHALSGVGTMAEQNKTSVDIEGGTIDNTTVGATTPAAGTFTTLTGNSTSQFGRSSTNYVQAVGAASAAGPVVSSQGSDTNIDLNLTTKGTGAVNLNTANGLALKVTDAGVGTIENYWRIEGRNISGGPTMYVEGAGTNINSIFTTKGSGSHSFTTSGSRSNNQLVVSHTASAVNYVQVTGAATGNSAGPTISAQGSDANVPLALAAKLAAAINFYTSGGFQQFAIAPTASAVNYVQVTGAATSGTPTISAQGSDTNAGMLYTSKGFGSHTFRGYNGSNTYLTVGTSQANPVNSLQLAASSSGNAVSLSALGSDTNIPLVLQPKGTGALQAQQTDSTATGGNARGANAVDWQTGRGGASQVASGQYNVIGGGFANTASAFNSTVAGGNGNVGAGSYCFIGGGLANNTSGQAYSSAVGGQSNTSAGYYNFVGGGFTNSATSSSAVTTQSGTMNGTTAVTLSGSNASIKVGQYITGTSIAGDTYVAAISGTSLTLSKNASGSSTSTLSFLTPHGVVVGGGNNQATGSYSFIGGGGDAGTAANRNVASGDFSFVGGGKANVASGLGSVVVGGGTFAGGPSPNTASGAASFIGGGFNNAASNFASIVIGGNGNASSGNYSCVTGVNGFTRAINNNFVISSNALSTTGDSQTAILVIRRQTTDATAIVLTSDGAAATTNNQVILPNNSAYFFRGTVVAGVTGGGNTKGWTVEGVIKRGANAASTALVGTPTVTSSYADAGASTWALTATADTTNGGLAITFTGQAATTIRTVAKIETTEMTY